VFEKCFSLFHAEMQPNKRTILILVSVNPLISITLKQKVGLSLHHWKVLEQGIKGTQGELLPDLWFKQYSISKGTFK